MEQMVVEMKSLQLPKKLADKLGTERVLIREVDEGLLLSPIPVQVKNIRGLLKGTGFSTERYFAQKRADKELEG